jgi:hypothetical protein
MKRLFQKFLLVGVFALAQVLFLTAANAGVFLHGKGDVLTGTAPNSIARYDLYTENGNGHCTVETCDLGGGTIEHFINCDDGSKLDVISPSTVNIRRMFEINEEVVSAFPELATLQGDSRYQLMTVAGNVSEDEAGVSWDAKGKAGTLLKGVCSIEIRCAYLVFNGRIIECLGCPFYMEKCKSAH